MTRLTRNRSGEVSVVDVVLAVLLIVVFLAAAYGISVNVGPYVPPWALVLVIALLGIGLVGFFSRQRRRREEF